MSYYNPITTIASVGTQSQPIPVTIASPTEPTTRPNGGSLRQGDNWYNTETSKDYIWIDNADGVTGSWRLVGQGAGGGTGTFTGGYVPNSIFVGGTDLNPNLTLSSDGGIIAENKVKIVTPTADGVAFVVTDPAETEGLRILADGTLQTGQKTGDSDAISVGIQLNPQGTIELGGATLRVEGETLYINDIPIIEQPDLNTANLLLVNPVEIPTRAAIQFGDNLTVLPPFGELNTQSDWNNWVYSAVEYLENDKISDAPVNGLIYGRKDKTWVQVTGITVKGTVPDVVDLDSVPNPVNGDLYVVESNGHGYVYESSNDPKWTDIGAIQGPPGPQGDPGQAATVTVGSTETGPAGSAAEVTNTGTVSNAVLDFVIPEGAQGAQGETGDKGDPGTPGAPGTPATATAGLTVTLPAGEDAIVEDVSPNANDAVFNFSIPQGLTGAKGDPGPQGNPGVNGTDGVTPTVQAGTTDTLPAGDPASVTEASGSTDTAVIFDFKIPQGAAGADGTPGAKGDPGNPGAAATVDAGSTSTLSAGSDATVTNTGTTSAAIFNFGIPQGAKGSDGAPGAPGTAATVDVGTTTTGAAGTNATVTNSGTTAAAVFNFTVPQGTQGVQGPQGEPGTSIAIAGTITSIVPGAAGGPPTYSAAGTMYIYSGSDAAIDGHGFVSDGATPDSAYTDIGQIQGPEGPQGPAGPVAGLNTQIIFNDNGAPAGAADLTFSNNTLTTDKISTTGDIEITGGGKFKGDGGGLTNLSFPATLSFQGLTNVTAAAPTTDVDGNPLAPGDYFMNDVAGQADSSWTGIGGNTVAKSQLVYYTQGSEWVEGSVQDQTAYLALSGGEMTGDIDFADTQTFPVSGLPAASTGQAGIVQLTNATDSTSESIAPTAKAISGLATDIATNASDISGIDTRLTTDEASTLQNTNNIATLTSDLADTDAQVEINKQGVADNATAAANAQAKADAALPKTGGKVTGNIEMEGTAVIEFSDSQTFPSDIPVDPTQLPNATLNTAGVTKLNDSVDSTSNGTDADNPEAATPNAVRKAYELASSASTTANAALPKAGGEMTGDITFAATQTFPIQVPDANALPKASLDEEGIVQLSDATDSTSIALAATANAAKKAFDRGNLGVTNAAQAQQTADSAKTTADAALPKSGGEMTGFIDFKEGQPFPGASGTVQSVNDIEPNAETGNITLTAANVGALSVSGGSMTATGDAQGIITFVDAQNFPGTGVVNTVNLKSVTEGTQNVELSAADVDAVSKKDGGTFGGLVYGVTTLSDSSPNTLTTKNYVDSLASQSGGGSVTSITAGEGLTTGSANPEITLSGTLSVEADPEGGAPTIIVDAEGIRVNKTNAAIITSVNTKVGAVVLSASDVGAVSAADGGTFEGQVVFGTGAEKTTINTAGNVTASYFNATGGVSVETENVSATTPVFSAETGGQTRFIVDADGTLRTGDDINPTTNAGTNFEVDPQGNVTATSFDGDGSDLTNVTATDPNALSKTETDPQDMAGNINMNTATQPVIIFSPNQTFPSDITPDPENLPDASLNSKGIVQLSNAVDSDSDGKASTPSATKQAFDKGVTALNAANAAQSDATQAGVDAAAASAAATTAKNTADAAQTDATQALTNAATADAKAVNAQTTADSAASAANTASVAAANAQLDADSAAAAAAVADGKAVAAQATANAALPKDGTEAMTGDLVVNGDITIPTGEGKFTGDGSGLTGLVLPPTTTFKGTTDVTTDTAPSAVAAGDTYLNLVAGAAGASWTGIATETIAVNQFVIYGDNNEWTAATILDDNAFVTIGTDQTITGDKAFSGDVTVPGTPAGASSATSKSYVDDAISNIDTGEGTVTSVNDIDPDSSGNVTLNASSVGAIGTNGGTMTGNLTMSEDDSAVIVFSSQQTFPSDIPVNPENLPEASGNTAGITLLSDSTTSTKDTTDQTAATPNAVKTAKDAADTADAKAVTAQGAAEDAADDAAAAQTDATQALANAATALQTAQAADVTANQGVTDAATADAKAVAAQNAANAAQGDATQAISDAADADTKADTAIANAATADGKAVQATTDAATADAKAVAAQATADAALPKDGTAGMSGTLNTQNIVIGDNYSISGDGSGLTNLTLPNAIDYQGTINCTTTDPTSTPAQGQMYLNLQQGTATEAWTGLTTVEQNQFVLFDGTNWDTGEILDGSAFVTLSTNQTITGTKTFSKVVTVPTPDAQDAAATKGYVDSTVGTEIGNIDFPVDSVNGDTGAVEITAASLNAMSLTQQAEQTMSGNINMKTNSAIIIFDDQQPFPSDIVPDTDLLPHATINQDGIVKLYAGVDSSSNGTDADDPLAATPSAVKTAYDKAVDAETDAATADDKAVAAQTTANLAHDEAGDAQTDATSALANAQTAQNTADAAKLAAEGAQETADAAVPKVGNTNITGDITITGNVSIPAGAKDDQGNLLTFSGDGSGLTNLDIPTAIAYKGTINCVTETAPASPQTGWSYLNTGTGTADSSWTGLQNVIAEQFILYNGNKWETGAVLDDAVYVTLATSQSVTGQKTFTSQVLIPEVPTQNASAASKKYVDAEIQTEFGKVDFPVTSVNGQAKGVDGNTDGAVVLNSSDVGALSTSLGGTMKGNIVMNEDDLAIIDFSSAQTFPGTITSIPEADATTSGTVKLSDSVVGTDDVDGGKAATPKAVKTANDAATAAASAASTADGKAVAAQADADAAQADATQAIADAAAAQATANAAMPKGGGTFSGDITTENITISTGHSISGDGSGLTNLNVPNSLEFKGTIDVTTGAAPTAASGDFYLNLVLGDADASYTGIADEQVKENQFVLYNGSAWSKGSILDGTAFVTLTSQQTITGSKTFDKEVILNAGPTSNKSATTKTYVDSTIDTKIGDIVFPVTKVNGNTGDVTITAASIDAMSLTDTSTQAMSGLITFAAGQSFPGSGDVHSVNNIDPVSGNVTLTADNVSALPIDGSTPMDGQITFDDGQQFPGVLSLKGGTMVEEGDANGIITFATNQTFPGTVTAVNNFTGNVTLDADDVGAIANDGGTFTNGLTGDSITLTGGDFRTDQNIIIGGYFKADDNLATDIVIESTVGDVTRFQIRADGSLKIGENIGAESGESVGVHIASEGDIAVTGIVVSRTTKDTDDDEVLTTKGYVLTKIGESGAGTVTEITAGDGLTTNLADGAPIEEVGTLAVVAANSTILVDATGIKVNPAALPAPPVTSVNSILPAEGTTNIVLTADNVAALPIDGSTTMTGTMTFFTGQTFPGTVVEVNGETPDGNGELNLTAADVDAVSKATGGTFGGAVAVTGDLEATGDIEVKGAGNKFKGDGSGLTNLNIPNSLEFKGTTNVSLSAPSANAGDFYLNTFAGEADDSWTGIGGDSVLNNQFVLYTVNNEWVEGATLDGSAFVTLATNQTIGGVKEFSEAVTIPETPVAATDAASKGYVDTSIGNIPAAPVTSVNGADGVVVLDADSVSALPIDGSTAMTGVMTFKDGQIFPGTVIQVNGESPDNGSIVLTAPDVDAVSATDGGTFSKAVLGPDVDADSNVSTLVNKKYVDAQISGIDTTDAVESVNGLTGVVKIGVEQLDDVSLPTATVFQWDTYSTNGAHQAAGRYDIRADGGRLMVNPVDSLGQDATALWMTPADGNVDVKWYISQGNGEFVEIDVPARLDQNAFLEALTLVPALTDSADASPLKISFGPPTTPLANGDVLAYNSTTSMWMPHQPDVTTVNGESGAVVLTATDVGGISDAGGTFTGTLTGESLTALAGDTLANIEITGHVSASGVVSFADPDDGAAQGSALRNGFVEATNTGQNSVFEGYTVGSATATTEIDAAGNANFAGNISGADGSFSGTVTPNVLSVTTNGTVGGTLSVTGNTVIGDDAEVTLDAADGNIVAKGEITAIKYYGDGSELTGIAGGVSIGATPPADPKSGDLWWSAEDGILYVWYTDPGVPGDDDMESSSQWVDTRPAGFDKDVVRVVNGKTGIIQLDAYDVGAVPKTGGSFTGTVTTPGIKLTGLTKLAVPYINASGELDTMDGVNYNAATQTLSVTKLESPSTGDIIVNAEFQAAGPVDCGDTLQVDKATTLNGSLDVSGVTTLTGLNVTGNLAHTGNHEVTGNVTATGTVTANAFVGDGSGLTNLPIPAATTFKGTIDATTATAPSAVDGDVYTNTGAGAAGASWTGINGQTLVANQLIFYATNQWELGGVEDVSTLVTLNTDQTIGGNKTFSNAVTAPNIISTGTAESTFAGTVSAPTGAFSKSNGRAIEIYAGTATLKAYWTGSGEVHATKFVQNGGNGANTFIGSISTTSTLSVSGASTFSNSLTVGTASTGVKLTTTGAVTAQQVSSTSALADKLQLTNLNGLSELPGSVVQGTIAMFQGVLYYYGTGDRWYMFNVTTRNPPN